MHSIAFTTLTQRIQSISVRVITRTYQLVARPTQRFLTTATRPTQTKHKMSAAVDTHTAISTPAVETNTQHNTKKGFNAATKNKGKNPNLIHILFIRHAESSNNVLAEWITKELGVNPYAPNSGQDVINEYDRRRLCDPHLSPLGEKQAELLIHHPHLKEIQLDTLSSEQRVRVITSPMKRAILTSMPMMKHYKLPRATLLPDMCEKGGSYVTKKDLAAGTHENIAHPGLKRAELADLYGATHDPSHCDEDGWWKTPSKGCEDHDAFDVRLQRAKSWIEEQALEYAKDPSKPDYLLIVSHADFIDSMITSMLKVGPHAKYVFYSSNTAIHHIEYEVTPETKREELVVRARGINLKPVSVASHELAIHHQLPETQHTTPLVGPPVNKLCPWSNDPVSMNALTTYRGSVVGFCKTECKDKFEKATKAFDQAIASAAANNTANK